MTRLPALDTHIFASLAYFPSQSSSLNRGDVIEVQGPACSGKTHFVYHFALNCILPDEVVFTAIDSDDDVQKRTRTIEFGGWNKAAIVMDTDGRWDIARFHHLLRHRLTRVLAATYDADDFQPSLSDLVTSCLQRLRIFRPTSSLSLAATLLQLPTYHATHLPDIPIGLLLIDSISTFYWEDRFNGEKHRGTTFTSLSPLNHVLTSLQKFRLSHGPVTVLTNWGLSPVKSTATDPPSSTLIDTQSTIPTPGGGHIPFYRQHLNPFPAPFEHPPRNLANLNSYPPITHHITLLLTLTPNLSDLATIHDAKEADTQRDEIVSKGQILGIIRTVESGRVGRFIFEIHADEICSSELLDSG
ncbi:hypothetical protein BD410DRAFT_780880 [Rickenella mellea]|uniref:DNA recombination and repair protein Rad51-like C-terminal domain-containing protein n=1 Tax=Rickenella mellea TaxID=50990 RepID=A0A4Y7QMA8_9AGAM|nr:hypothetical protein BD410DRAFT_780880 [Rickenella mellea]